MSKNPLSDHFRRPSIYVKLPSNGNFYPPDSIDMPENKELPVYPMTAIDEISYRTPDALFNGSAIIDVVQSCIPNIKNAWHMPSIDIDAILSAIRIASYGHALEIKSTCPECNENGEFSVDLRVILDSMKCPNYTKTLVLNDLTIGFKPLTYQNINDNSMIQFNEEKLASVVESSALSDKEKLDHLTSAFKAVAVGSVTTLGQSIGYIQTGNTLVTEEKFIIEFLENCDLSFYDSVKTHVIALKDEIALKPIDITCDKCDVEYTQPFTLDLSSFFG